MNGLAVGFRDNPQPVSALRDPNPMANAPIGLALPPLGRSERASDIGGVDIAAPRLAHDM